MIRIRDAVREDYGQIVMLLSNLQEVHERARPDIFQEGQVVMEEQEFLAWMAESAATLIAEHEGLVVGMIVLRMKEVSNPILVKRKIGFIDDFVVDSAYRRKGIGQLLFDEVKRIAVEKGAESLELNVWSFNKAAIHFYEKNGMNPLMMNLECKL